MICPFCKEEIPENSPYCPQCYHTLPVQKAEKPVETVAASTFWIVILIGLVAIGGLIARIYGNNTLNIMDSKQETIDTDVLMEQLNGATATIDELELELVDANMALDLYESLSYDYEHSNIGYYSENFYAKTPIVFGKVGETVRIPVVCKRHGVTCYCESYCGTYDWWWSDAGWKNNTIELVVPISQAGMEMFDLTITGYDDEFWVYVIGEE